MNSSVYQHCLAVEAQSIVTGLTTELLRLCRIIARLLPVTETREFADCGDIAKLLQFHCSCRLLFQKTPCTSQLLKQF